MDFIKAQKILDTAVPVKVLQMNSRALVVAFLHFAFKAQANSRLTHERLHRLLVNFLEEHDPATESLTANTVRAEKMLETWVDKNHNILYKVRGENELYYYELTPEAELLFNWIESLQKQTFVGTESRFQAIFTTLREVTERSHSDPDRRIKELKQQQEALQKEIDTINQTKRVAPFTDTQIKERYLQVQNTARALLSDFAAIRRNFNELALELIHEQLKSVANRGQLLGQAIEAIEKMNQSDQGRSFRAFWDLLLSESRSIEMEELVAQTNRILQERGISEPDPFLLELRNRLFISGQEVVEARQLLTTKLRRVLAENSLREHQQSLNLTQEIKALALETRKNPPNDESWIAIDGLPTIHLPLERPACFEPDEEKVYQQPIEKPATHTEEDLSPLFEQLDLDEGPVRERLAALLSEKQTVSLSEVLNITPLEHDLPELLLYYKLASELSALYDEEEQLKVPLDDQYCAIAPNIIFSR